MTKVQLDRTAKLRWGVTWNNTHTKKKKKEKIATVHHERGCNVKRMQYGKKCNMKRVQDEKNVIRKNWNRISL